MEPLFLAAAVLARRWAESTGDVASVPELLETQSREAQTC